MNIRLLNTDDFDQLYQSFQLTFSSNQVNFSSSKDEFDIRIHKKLNIDYDLSAAAFDGDKMLGFIMHTSNIYHGVPTAYNGGTGVIPGFRNQQTGEDIYRFLIPLIREKALVRILLEVIESNPTAIRLYEKLGFTVRRRFKCYKSDKDISTKRGIEPGIIQLHELHNLFFDFEPSFIDSNTQLIFNAAHEKTLIVKIDGKTAGFLVFQPDLGRISQLSISKEFRRRGIGTALVATAQELSTKRLSIMNIPDDEYGFQYFLANCSFENQVNQFEMELIL